MGEPDAPRRRVRVRSADDLMRTEVLFRPVAAVQGRAQLSFLMASLGLALLP